MKNLLKFFDKFEDHVRGHLSRYPVIYSLIGGFAIVLFWRSVWEITNLLEWNPYITLIISICILLATGLFVSFFVGDTILISGIKKEKKLIEKTEEEVDEEVGFLQKVDEDLKADIKERRALAEEVSELRKEIKNLSENRNSHG
jgi:hypothetical protein